MAEIGTYYHAIILSDRAMQMIKELFYNETKKENNYCG